MALIHPRSEWAGFIFLFFGCIAMLTPASLIADVLLRHTMENYQGGLDTLGWTWTGDVERRPESGEQYQTQAHGARSLRIKDDNSSSYSNASHAFPTIDPGDEYMVEFYLWVPTGVSIDNMYLYKPATEGDSADIQLLLHSVNGQTLTVHVRDKNGIEPCGVGLESGI